MEKHLHLICNAHIDPVWQWEWEEGAAEAISTFRCAAQFCREFDGFVFCHNEAILYQWVEEYEPALFEEIGALIKDGKWHVMGGWFLQPDCNMPSGEGFVRNILYGRTYFSEKFGVKPNTAINLDPFGHTRGLVQIMAKAGFDGYLITRPDNGSCPLPSNLIRWVGYDGSSILVGRQTDGYNSPRGNAIAKISGHVDSLAQNEATEAFCLWGVGDHGGGPSRIDIRAINDTIDIWAEKGVKVTHSTPDRFFHAVRQSDSEIPVHEGDLNRWAVGCYTSQVQIKQKYRRLENQFLLCEKMCAQLSASSDFVYPKNELDAALYDLLTVQFHDSLPGSSIQPVEEMCLRMIDHGLEICSRVRARAFFALCNGQKAARDGEIPIMCYNPHPYPVEDDFEVEFMLEDQNWSDTFTSVQIYQGDTAIPTQVEKEQSNIPLDWRKRISFHATLAPMQITRFDCHLSRRERKPIPSLPSVGDAFLFEHGRMQILINKNTGLIDRCTVDGDDMLLPGALSIDVYQDNEDPWGMTVSGFYERKDAFTLLSAEEGSEFSALPSLVESVRVIEDGPVRSVVEAVFGYRSSRAVVHYLISKVAPTLDLSIRICNNEKKIMYKLAVPFAASDTKAVAEVAYGEETILKGGIENPGQKYIRMTGEGKTLSILNRGIYGYSMEENKLLFSLMRAPAYTAHPLPGRNTLPSDRHMPYIEQGERLFDLRLRFGDDENKVAALAQAYNEAPVVLSFFPSGIEKSAYKPFYSLSDPVILPTAFKLAENGQGYILRFFNPAADSVKCILRLSDGRESEVAFGKYEIKTYRITSDAITETNLLEESK